MLTCFTVITAIATLTLSTPLPRPSDWERRGIPIQLTKRSPSLNSEKNINADGLKAHAASSYMALKNDERDTGTSHTFALERSGSRNRRQGGGAGLDLLIDPDDDMWYCTISIGTPPKLFTVQIDTGSSDIFLPWSVGDDNCKTHDHLWDPASSETARALGKPFQLRFKDGADAGGMQYSDNITIAGFTADRQTIGAAATYSDNLRKSVFPSDGLLGLAFSSLSRYPASPLIETLVNEGKLTGAMFSLKLTSDGGEMYIGGMNEKLYAGDITFVDVQTTELWTVIVDGIRVNGKLVVRNVVSIIDTGANYIYGDPAGILALHRAHGGKAFVDGWHTFPCDGFPDVTLTFGGNPFTIPADDLNLGPVEDGSPDCFSGMVALKGDIEHWTIGTNFLERVYTVFNVDHDPPQVGFARLKELREA